MHLHFKINESKCQIVFWSIWALLTTDILHLLKHLYDGDKPEMFLKFYKHVSVSSRYFTTLWLLTLAKEVCYEKNVLSKYGTHKNNQKWYFP